MDAKLKRMIGQMMMVGFPSLEMDEQVERLLEDFEVGNYVYFSRNMKTAAQVARLSKAISDRVYDKLGAAPFITADQEGGGVSRLIEGSALMSGAMAVAATVPNGTVAATEEGATAPSSGGRPRLTREQALARVEKLGENCGQILRSVGVNFNLAPDLDVNIEPKNPIIGTRSYGDDPDQVVDKAIAMMRGLQAGGVMATLKHFPGHGNVSTDSHLDVPHNTTSWEELEKTEFVTFEKAIKNGANGIMTAHVCYDKVDPDTPGTLSKVIQTGLLREKFGFEGIAMTDCMEMDAIRANIGIGEGAVRAIEAGMDILTISHTYDAAKQAVEGIYAALESGRLTEERIQLSYDRIMKMKEKMGLLERQDIDEAKAAKVIMAADKLLLCREVAADSVTLLQGNVKLDVTKPDFLVIAPDGVSSTGAEDLKPVSFADRAAARYGCLAAKIPLNGEADAAKAMLESAVKMGFKKVVLGLFNARFREGQIKVLRELEAMVGVQLIVVLLGAPYDYPMIERADAVVCSYDYTSLSVEAVLDALVSGEFVGQCPVKLD